MLNVISLGAGVQSSAMALMFAAGELTPMPDAAIFADTGAEPKSVYKYLEYLKEQLPFPVYVLKEKNLLKDILKLKADPASLDFLAPPFFSKNELGNKVPLARQCTSQYKIRPVRRKLKELLGRDPEYKIHSKKPLATQYIGISTDEAHRQKPGLAVWIKNAYPLIDKNMTRWDCLNWIQKNGHPQPEKSSCTFCPYHSDRAWVELKKTSDWDDIVRVDKVIRNLPRDGLSKGLKQGGELYLHRSCKPIDEIEFNVNDKQPDMFGNECFGMCGN